MTPHSRWDELYHDIKSKSASLRTAVGLLEDASASEQKELLALMGRTSRDIALCLAEMEKELGSGRRTP